MVWLSIDQMAELFQRDKPTISRHIKNIFTEGEPRPESTVAKVATVQAGVNYDKEAKGTEKKHHTCVMEKQPGCA